MAEPKILRGLIYAKKNKSKRRRKQIARYRWELGVKCARVLRALAQSM